jgi:hypothetical protein
MAAMAQITHCTAVRRCGAAAGDWAILLDFPLNLNFQVVWHSRVEDFMMLDQSAIVTKKREGKRSKMWIVFVIGAVLSWGVYGPALHKGQTQLGNPLKALLCVGFAYFLIGVLVPVAGLSSQGGLSGFNAGGTVWSIIGGALGALGAVCIIWAFKAGGIPNYVMPLVFGGAPLVNVLVSMAMHPPKNAPHPLLYVGFLLAAAGGGIVLYYKPS